LAFRYNIGRWPEDWKEWFAYLGVIGAAGTAALSTSTNQVARAWSISIGCGLTIPHLYRIMEVSTDEFYRTRLPYDWYIWPAAVCFGLAVAIAWISVKPV
jgi:hypothetical protein